MSDIMQQLVVLCEVALRLGQEIPESTFLTT